MKGKNFSDESIVENIVDVSRVTKVVKGGRKFSFSVCLIAGNQDGMVGYGHGKAKEVPEAKIKASQDARKSLVKIPLYQGRTIHHDVIGRSGSGHVLLRKAMPGTGIIAGGPMRKILECLGIKDIVAKSLGSSNTYNMIAATFNALKNLNSPKMIAEKRGKKPNEISSRPKQNKGE
jgi:small subunit ribosomal protein S5